MSDSRSFDDLPPEVKKIIWEFINEKKDMAAGASVTPEWHAFFDPKIKDQFFLHLLANDKDACKKINMEQLTAAVDVYLRESDPKRIADLFLALKKFESEIIDIDVNPARRAEKEKVKIARQAMQTLLKSRFGVAGLVHSHSLVEMLKSVGNQDTAVPFLALEKLLQQDANKHGNALELINLLGTHGVFVLPPQGQQAMIGEGATPISFGFADNRLSVVLTMEGTSMPFALTDLIATSFEAQQIPEMAQKTQRLLEELSGAELKKTLIYK